MPEEQITRWGRESINVALLKTTTILSQQMAKWQYNALLTLYQGHLCLSTHLKGKKNHHTPNPSIYELFLYQEELLLSQPSYWGMFYETQVMTFHCSPMKAGRALWQVPSWLTMNNTIICNYVNVLLLQWCHLQHVWYACERWWGHQSR